MLTAAGILNIISGVVQLLVAIGAFRWLYSGEGFTEYEHSPEYTPEGYLLRFFLPFFISGILAIGGGINAVKRDKMLGLVWAGAIAASFPLLISWSFLSEMFALVFGSKAFTLTGLLGIASLILVGQYKTGFLKEIWKRLLSVNWMEVTKRPVWCYGQGLQRFWKYFPRLLLIQVILIVLSVVIPCLLLTQVMRWDPSESYWFVALIGVPYFILLCGPLNLGVLYAFLKAARGDKPGIPDMFAAFRNYGNAILVSLIFSLIIFGFHFVFYAVSFIPTRLGFLIPILPEILLIYLLCSLIFTPYLIVENKWGAVKAIKESWFMMRGHTMTVFFIGLLWLTMSFLLTSLSLSIVHIQYPLDLGSFLSNLPGAFIIYLMVFAVPSLISLYLLYVPMFIYGIVMAIAFMSNVTIIVILTYVASNLLMIWAGLAVSSFYRVVRIVSQSSDSSQ